MPDWERYVRERLSSAVSAPNASEIVRELAANLEDVRQDALRDGMGAAEAERAAMGHIQDWDRLSADLRNADPEGLEPRLDRLADRLLEAPVEGQEGAAVDGPRPGRAVLREAPRGGAGVHGGVRPGPGHRHRYHGDDVRPG